MVAATAVPEPGSRLPPEALLSSARLCRTTAVLARARSTALRARSVEERVAASVVMTRAATRAATLPPRVASKRPDEPEREIEAMELEIRDRIADGLNGRVVRRLFSLGLTVSSLASQMTDPLLQQRLTNISHELDDAIAEVRFSVWPAARGQGPPTGDRSEPGRVSADRILLGS
jgi:signal transduction histidine kinase